MRETKRSVHDDDHVSETPPSAEKSEPRGFARLDPEHRRRIAQAGGEAAQRSEKVRRWSADTARKMGRLGGIATRERGRASQP